MFADLTVYCGWQTENNLSQYASNVCPWTEITQTVGKRSCSWQLWIKLLCCLVTCHSYYITSEY